MKVFEYIGRTPRNICFHGTSFPVYPGCTIAAPEEWLKAQLPPKQLKLVTKTGITPKLRFPPGSKRMLFTDPTGGLPVKSVPGKPKTARSLVPSPATTEIPDKDYLNPYDLGMAKREEEEPTLTLSTQPGVVAPEIPGPGPVTTPPPAKIAPEPTTESHPGTTEDILEVAAEEVLAAPAVEAEDAPEDVSGPELGEEAVVEAEDGIVADSGPRIPTKTALKKLLKSELVSLAHDISAAEAPLNGGMKTALAEVTLETHKVPILTMLLEYYGLED